jgi:hypothetical protein
VSLVLLLIVGTVCLIELRAGLGQYLSGKALQSKSEGGLGVFQDLTFADAKAQLSMLPTESLAKETEVERVYRYHWFSMLRGLIGESAPEIYIVSSTSEPAMATSFYTSAEDQNGFNPEYVQPDTGQQDGGAGGPPSPPPMPGAPGMFPPGGSGGPGGGMRGPGGMGGPGGGMRGPGGMGGPGGGMGGGRGNGQGGGRKRPPVEGEESAAPAPDAPAPDAPAPDAPAPDAPAPDAPAPDAPAPDAPAPDAPAPDAPAPDGPGGV